MRKFWNHFFIVAAIVASTPALADALGDAEAAYTKKDYATALKLLRPLAEQGVAKAQHGVALHYAHGYGIDKDYGEAIKWERLAATQGYPNAQAALGLMYGKGQGVQQDYSEAIKWYKKAGDQGDVSAQRNLGYIFINGRGVPRDYVEAAKWLGKAAAKGDAGAQAQLGDMYANGLGVEPNYREAINFYRMIDSSGDSAKSKQIEENVRLLEAAIKQLSASNGWLFNQKNDELTLYIRPQMKGDGVVAVYALIDYNSVKSVPNQYGYLSSIVSYQVDCVHNNSRLISSTDYNKNMAAGNVRATYDLRNNECRLSP